MNKIFIKFKDGSEREHNCISDEVGLGGPLMSFQSEENVTHIYNLDYIVGWKFMKSKIKVPNKELKLV